ncbi:GtrA family protein [Pedobacter endophyticus]|uniref:GtrA family protein n=1 Tax=Pedobacter endophyticus TaxID=2789740 RepID=A0A7U3SQA1_9SPHI|nr:GtrA family protein [Pedobacter endophyticus]QPH38719.1 GtrA family protein [Pedobacter endophyticus]
MYLNKYVQRFLPMAIKVVKYGVIGLFGMAIDFSLTYLLIESFSMDKFIASTIGFIIAVINNYLLNSKWTFGKQKNSSNSKFMCFFIIGLAGLAINYLSIFLLHTYGRVDIYLSKLVAVGIVFFWNFMTNYYITFKNSERMFT